MNTVEQIRNWLGIFLLGTTCVLGAYIILFQETRLLPISAADAASAFKIIIPTLIAQLTVAFKWIANPPPDSGGPARIPRWAVIGPPLAVDVILVVTIAWLALDAGREVNGGEMFKNVVTFCVSLLSASTVFIVSAVFATPPHPESPAPLPPTSR